MGQIKLFDRKNAVLCDVTPCGSCKNPHFGELSESINKSQSPIVLFRSLHRLLVKANVPNSLIVVTLMMEALSSSETFVRTRATLRHIAEDGILHSHRRVNLKSYIALTGWCL
jgi:hypothetical protein